jgi:hypothetical protein
MRLVIVAPGVLLAGVLLAGGALAGPREEVAQGQAAYERGDNDLAIRLLTDALSSGALSRGQREKALVARANAELATDQRTQAIADADAAITLNAGNAEAAALKSRALQRTGAEASDVRVRAEVSVDHRGDAPAVTAAESLNGEVKNFNEGVAQRNAASQADFDAGVAHQHDQASSDADAYARARAAYEARARDIAARHQADMAEWRAQVKACKVHRGAQCGEATPPP